MALCLVAGVPVADLSRALPYYTAPLGFALAGAYAGVVRDGCRVHLQHAAPLERDRGRLQAEEHVDACFEVEVEQALAAAFSQAGDDACVPLGEQPYGRECYVRDPDGCTLGFVQVPRAPGV